MKAVLFVLLVLLSFTTYSQDTTKKAPVVNGGGIVMVQKDPRLDILAKKEAEFNEANANGLKAGKGYRLMLLSTSDRNAAMSLRSQLLQRYPDQKVYMSFQPPYIKLKFGNFLEKEEADNFKKEIVKAKLVSSNIYVVPEIIEVKPEKLREKEKEKEKENNNQ